MCNRAKQGAALFLPVLFFGILLLGACENDLNKIKEISARQKSLPIDTTRGVEVLYSDSAIVKGKMITPVLIHHEVAKSFYEMPKGVKVIFYDRSQKETGTIVADSGVYREKEQIIEFYKNVVGSNPVGYMYKSDELIWDQVKRIVYSNKPVQLINVKTGEYQNSNSFESDDKFITKSFPHGYGSFDFENSGLK
jgi:LPS export ABC transporter protein LptC